MGGHAQRAAVRCRGGAVGELLRVVDLQPRRGQSVPVDGVATDVPGKDERAQVRVDVDVGAAVDQVPVDGVGHEPPPRVGAAGDLAGDLRRDRLPVQQTDPVRRRRRVRRSVTRSYATCAEAARFRRRRPVLVHHAQHPRG